MLSVMVSCKKDDETSVSETKNPMTEKQMSETEKRVLSFLEVMEQHDNGVKSDETMTYEEAVVLWENTLNYCHSFTSTPVENMQFDTIYVKIRGVNGETISTSDAVEAYNNLIEDVREVYSNIEIADKKLHYVMIDANEESAAKEGCSEVRVVVMTGSETQRDEPPFSTTPWYGIPFVGDNTYHVVFSANHLTRAVKDYDMNHQMLYTPGPNLYTYVHSYQLAYSYNANYCDWVYYGSNDSILSTSTMNQLYADIMLHTHAEDMVVNLYGIYSYYETIVNNKTISDSESLSHVINVYFAVREWRDKGQIGVEYPVDIVPSN